MGGRENAWLRGQHLGENEAVKKGADGAKVALANQVLHIGPGKEERGLDMTRASNIVLGRSGVGYRAA